MLSHGQRFGLRIALLATVNAGAYVAYVSAIRSAKSGTDAYVGVDGSTDHSGAVRRSYAQYLGLRPREPTKEAECEK